MDFISDALKRYVSLPQTQYALQINGAWGTGKTYYVKNNLIEEIELIKNSEGQNYKCCYVSLNGFSNIDQIGEAVFFGLAEDKNKIAYQGAKYLGRYGGMFNFLGDFSEVTKNLKEDITNVLSKSSEKLLKNIVLIFDDLERINDNLSLKQVFGYINSNYIESEQVKVLFISNDEKIDNSSNYREIKEKVIGRTLEFKHTNPEIIESIIHSVYSSNDEFIKFFDDEKGEIIPVILFVLDKLNLRTLRFVLDTFSILHTEIIKAGIYNKSLFKTIFLNVLIISKEYKDGNVSSPQKFDFLHDYYFHFINTSTNNEQNYEKTFSEKYHQNNDYILKNAHYFRSVSNYVIEGHLNVENFIQQIQNYLAYKTKSLTKSTDQEIPAIDVLNYFTLYEDDVLKQAQIEVISNIQDEIYMCTEIIEITSIFLRLKDEDMLFDETQNAEQILNGKFEKLIEEWVIPERFEVWDLKIRSLHEGVAHMIRDLRNKYEQKNYEQRKQALHRWLQALIADKMTKEIYEKVEFEKDFFKMLVNLNFIEYLSYSNEFIVNIIRHLSQKYLRITNASDFHSHEVECVEELINGVTTYLENNSDKLGKVKKYNIQSLIEKLSEVKKHIEK